MTKFYFKNAEELMRGINILAPDRKFIISDEKDADITVDVECVSENLSEVTLDSGHAKIVYGGGRARFFRALAQLVAWCKNGITKSAVKEYPLFDSNGAMVDMSRNIVLSVKYVKFMLRKMALMGLNTYMLYTEDTYEIEGRGYFGYMRGRYTKEELKELDRYALDLGIELIPCVQFLGHLATHLRWSAAGAYKDSANALFVGEDATYELIDDMLKTISECFTTRRLHMGMDETHDLGIGAYLTKNGYKKRSEIFLEHLARVTKMAEDYGFKPMMWSDMFYHLATEDLPYRSYDYDPAIVISDKIKAKIPKNVQQVFWDYYHDGEYFYAENIKKHKEFCENTMFAGGVWLWSGICPHYSRSLRFTFPALNACKKGGVKEVIATIWVSGGAEGSLVFGLPGLLWYADYDYKGERDDSSIAELCKNILDLSYEDFLALELPEHADGGMATVAKALTYNDPLVGLIDKHVEKLDTLPYYQAASERLSRIATDEHYAPAVNTVRALSSLLENKADFGVRLKNAYDQKDKAALTALLAECDVIIEKLKALRSAHKENWFFYNKPFGWETFDIRYGGLVMRFETTKDRLSDLLSGKTESIAELEEERLRLNNTPDDSAPFGESFVWYGYQTLATASKI